MSPRIPSSTQIEPYRNAGARRIAGLAVPCDRLRRRRGLAPARTRATGRAATAAPCSWPSRRSRRSPACAAAPLAAAPRAAATLRITGSDLEDVTEVTFHGSVGLARRLPAKVRSGSRRRVHAVVPYGAVTGPLSADGAGRTPLGPHQAGVHPARAAARAQRRALPRPRPPPEGRPHASRPAPAAPRPSSASRRTVTFSYRISRRLAVERRGGAGARPRRLGGPQVDAPRSTRAPSRT